MKQALILAALVLSVAGCNRNDGINGGQIAAGVNQQFCPTQTQGRTEGDKGCTPRPKPETTQGRTN